ncbi:MAG: hypothetical protein AB1899_06015 [Pseudomonadota bacterium]
MKTLLFLAAIAAMVCTVLATLSAIVFCLGMGANAKPPEIRTLKLWMLGFSVLGVAGIGAGLYLLRAGQVAWAAGASLAPTVVIGVVFVVAMLR